MSIEILPTMKKEEEDGQNVIFGTIEFSSLFRYIMMDISGVKSLVEHDFEG